MNHTIMKKKMNRKKPWVNRNLPGTSLPSRNQSPMSTPVVAPPPSTLRSPKPSNTALPQFPPSLTTKTPPILNQTIKSLDRVFGLMAVMVWVAVRQPPPLGLGKVW
ncbi:uncharacterized protein LOC132302360 [Cornus florida]|uniref:uncharacterized protein LOC132302360 n=1 Tax=Cornus florida TaxID=4283 RepID=UPI0028975E75|nr:uncharacterized protein LOC132302360 [Cornus florida]